MYQTLTAYLSEIENDSFGEGIIDKNNDNTSEYPVQMPFVKYSEMVHHFIDDIYLFVENHPEYELNRYSDILTENNIEWKNESMQKADVSVLDGKCIMALLLGAVRSERFCDGALLSFFKSGAIAKWLLRLKELDRSQP